MQHSIDLIPQQNFSASCKGLININPVLFFLISNFTDAEKQQK